MSTFPLYYAFVIPSKSNTSPPTPPTKAQTMYSGYGDDNSNNLTAGLSGGGLVAMMFLIKKLVQTLVKQNASKKTLNDQIITLEDSLISFF